MEPTPWEDDAADAFATASRALVGIAVRSVGAAPVEVTLTQHRVLVLVATSGGSTVKALAGHLQVNASNASRLCDRLQRLGLLARSRSTVDGRAVIVSLTGLGRDVLEAVHAQRRREIEAVIARMPAHEVAQAITSLTAFADAAQEVGGAEWAEAIG